MKLSSSVMACHGRLWCACFSSKGALCVRCMDKFVRVENCPPRRNAPVEALGVLLGESPPWPNERPGVEDTGGERGEYRTWRCCAFRSPPSSERSLPGEGRIVTGGVRHAQHRLLNFRGYDARNNGAARSGFPSSLGCDPRKGRLVTESRLRVAGAPRCALRYPPLHGCVPRKGRLGAAGQSSRHSWLHGYLLLLAPLRPRL